MGRVCIPLLVAGAMIACEGDKPKVKTATPQSTDTSKTDTERQRTKQPIDSRVRALPAMSSPSDGEPTIRARRLTDRALELHRSRRYDDALATYAQAIATDPSNTLARYNLAALLVSMKKPESALHVLGVLRDFACTSCLQRVRDARTDEEWKPLWSDERFMRLTNVSGGGPTADVLAFYLAPNHVNVGKSHFEAVILIDPPPGFASAPKLELTFAENGTPADRGHRSGRLRRFRGENELSQAEERLPGHAHRGWQLQSHVAWTRR